MEKFIGGLAVGAVLGALLVANSNKTRLLVKKGQEECMQKIDAYLDEKLGGMSAGGRGKRGAKRPPEKKKRGRSCPRAGRRTAKPAPRGRFLPFFLFLPAARGDFKANGAPRRENRLTARRKNSTINGRVRERSRE